MTDAHSNVYCILGNPVRHSMSPHVHNAAFEKCGINSVYVAFEVKDVEGSVRGIRALGIAGASVTIPHKLAVMPLLDEIDPVATMIGAVNTIVNDNGKLLGLNTDGPGAVKALKEAGIDPQGKKVAIIGSGGASRAVCFSLAAQEKVDRIDVIGIIPDEIKQLSGEIADKTGVSTEAIMLDMEETKAQQTITAADIVANASPIGMHPNENETPIPVEWIDPKAAVFDVIYNPLETRLLKEAAEQGCKTIQGVEMFINQAVLQFEAWTKESAPVELMRRIVLENLGAK